MAKFSEYGFDAEDDDGNAIVNSGRVSALGLEQAWHKAVAAAYEAIEPGTGAQLSQLTVYRIKPASETHG